MKSRAGGPPPTRPDEPVQLAVDEIYRRFRRRARLLQEIGALLEKAEMLAVGVVEAPSILGCIEMAHELAAEQARRALFALPQVVRRCK